jgi:hypothetical protein
MEVKPFDLDLYSLIFEGHEKRWLPGPLEPFELQKRYGWLIKPN